MTSITASSPFCGVTNINSRRSRILDILDMDESWVMSSPVGVPTSHMTTTMAVSVSSNPCVILPFMFQAFQLKATNGCLTRDIGYIC